MLADTPVLAIDPGSQGGASVVVWKKGFFHLLDCFPIFGSYQWMERRSRDAVTRAKDMGVKTMVLEVPPDQVKRHGGKVFKHDRSGARSFFYLGLHAGIPVAIAAGAGLDIVRLPVPDWTAAHRGICKTKKIGDHSHRVKEANLICPGAKAVLDRHKGATANSYRRYIGMAESVLIGTGYLALS